MKLALDSNVLIAALSGNEAGSIAAQKLVRDIAKGKHQAVVSSIGYGEVLALNQGADIDLSGLFKSISNLVTVAADDDVCAVAGRLRKKYGGRLKLPDALHLATAAHSGANEFITDDKILQKLGAPEIKIVGL